MSLMSEIKYAYLFIFFILFVAILIIICLRITNCLHRIIKKDNYVWYMDAEQRYNTIAAYPKIIILSIIGIIDSVVLFAVISTLSKY